MRKCHKKDLGFVGLRSTLDYFQSSSGMLSGQALDFNIYQQQVRWASAILSYTALLHNAYQITNRALDAFLRYCEPKCHTMAFALPVVQWCHFLLKNNSLIHSLVQLLHESSKISVGVNFNQIKLNDKHNSYCCPFSPDHRDDTDKYRRERP